MEQFVEFLATKLLADDYRLIVEAIDAGNAYQSGDLHRDPSLACTPIRFARLHQELLAYKHGTILKKLLTQVCSFAQLAVSRDKAKLAFHSCSVLVNLSASQVVARYCLHDAKTTRMLARSLLDIHKVTVSAGIGCAQHMVPGQEHEAGKAGTNAFMMSMALITIKGLVFFARASKAFRRALKDMEDLFPALEYLILEDFVRIVEGTGMVDDTMRTVFCLMDTLLLFEDSQEWAFDRGLVRIHGRTGKYMLTVSRTYMFDVMRSRGYPVSLAEVENAVTPSYLDYDRRIRDTAGNKQDAMEARATYLESVKEGWASNLARRLSGLKDTPASTETSAPADAETATQASASEESPTSTMNDDFHAEALKALCERAASDPKLLVNEASGRNEMPVVCSWDMCEEGPLSEAGRSYSKCANCSFAFYCSKEHQKLHWRTHKKQCKYVA